MDNDDSVEPHEYTDADDSDLDQPPTAAEKQARIDYLKRLAPPPKPKKKWPWIVLAIVLIAVAAGAAAYLIFSKPKATKSTSQTKTVTTATVAPNNQSPSASTVHYISNGQELNLSFDYPSDWTVTPASESNSNDQTITLNSPLTNIVGADGKSVTGKVVVAIRPARVGLTELASGQATAGQTSVQIAYSKPTASQFQYPYLIFIHLAGGANPSSAFEEVLISGNVHFDKGQGISNVTPDPIITASFYACTTATCIAKSATPLGVTNSTWTNDTLFKQTLALLESLRIN
jgi:hypothetical protein